MGARIGPTTISHRQWSPASTVKPSEPKKTKLRARMAQRPEKDRVRAAAAFAVKRMGRSRSGIKHFDQVVQAYCEIVMRYRDRFVVVDYIMQQMKRRISNHAAAPTLTEVTSVFLGRLANEVLMQVEENIRSLLAHGTLMDVQLPGARRVVHARTSERSKYPCCLIFEETAQGERVIIALQSAQAFARTQKRRRKPERRMLRDSKRMHRRREQEQERRGKWLN